ncbi:hypothetical protein GCM10027447_12580 [Glycomyces halotolerans]
MTDAFKETAGDLNTTRDVQGDLNQPAAGAAPMSSAEQAAAEALDGHQIEYIDEEFGFACSCDEDGALVVPLRSDAEAHQARAVVAAVRPVIEAEALKLVSKDIAKHAEWTVALDDPRLPHVSGRIRGIREAAGIALRAAERQAEGSD